MYRTTPPVIRLSDYRPPEFLIDTVALRFELDDQHTEVEAELSLRRNPAATRGNGDLRLDGEQLELKTISLNDRSLAPAEFQVEEDHLIVRRVPDRFQLQTRVRLHPSANTALEGLYVSGGMLCTQCEAEGFRRITYFLDRPDVMATYRVTLIADPERYPVLLANGNPAGEERLADGRLCVHWDDPFPKPSYLFAVVAGALSAVEETFKTASGRRVPLRIYVEPGNEAKCAHAMQSLIRAMRWDEERYGREYDLEVFNIVAVSHFNMGAMENKGLNVFNAKYILASPESATDADFAGIEGVVAHEYFHNWTGNRITCRDWFQLSLKEGFTVYRDQEFSADMGSRGVKRIEDVRMLRARQFPEDSGPMAHPVRPDSYIEINNFYTATVYEKGAELVRMQAHLLGPKRFRKATDLYFERFDGQAVTTDDFVDCMESAGGIDLTQFKRWYRQAGTPQLDCSDRYDPVAGTYQLEVRQHTPATPGQAEKQPLHIPLALGLLDADGQDLPLQLQGETKAAAPGTRMLELRQPVETFVFTGLAAQPVPSLLRGFSAPVQVCYPYTDEQLSFLMAHDSDGFNRWDAAQTLAQRLLLAMVADPALAVPDSFIAAFERALSDATATTAGGATDAIDPAGAAKTSDAALIAEVLSLPSESYLGDQMQVVDVDGIHRARQALAAEIGRTLREPLLAAYRRTRSDVGFDLSHASMGRRALGNLCLSYLVRAGDAEGLSLAQRQFEAQQNMTDVIAALRMLIEAPAPTSADAQAGVSEQAVGVAVVTGLFGAGIGAVVGAGARGEQEGRDLGEELLAAFYQRWSGEPLVLDKWFALQAQSSQTDTLARVEQLLTHPDFSLTNPNRVRALIGAFAAGNPVRFHAADGTGYRFLTDRILELDPLNPQIASRLLYPMTRWRRYDEGRQQQMRAQLERILEVEGLSNDVYEVVSKSLG
ncbi:aminopeptidase N [Halochromatium roseum]|uniref:aminopeptidase N n=1 Tax=Halochromatium roseum TaxID=391920 RepID=UPI001913B8E1|nr:aminopeptidase N [Halochromatium roseum]MBK5939025.1 aminopeptidase N [Halochromatium roseum]